MSETDIILGLATFGIIGTVFGFLKLASRRHASPVETLVHVDAQEKATQSETDQATSAASDMPTIIGGSEVRNTAGSGYMLIPTGLRSEDFARMERFLAGSAMIGGVPRAKREPVFYHPTVAFAGGEVAPVPSSPELLAAMTMAPYRDSSAIRQRARRLKKAQILACR